MKFSSYCNQCFVLLLYLTAECYDIWSNSEAMLVFRADEIDRFPMEGHMYAEFTIDNECCKEKWQR